MAQSLSVDVCVIGAGSGGLTVAAGACLLGARVALIERHRMGGDCLNYGCVPSKALIAAAKAAQDAREARRFGVAAADVAVDFRAVHDHVHGVIAAIAPHDSIPRYRGLGAHVILDQARFVGRDTVRAGDVEVRARRVVVATGSSPLVPPVPGLATVPYLTNESVFDLDRLPEHMLVLGGGPVGLELAQAFRRLGSRVTVVEMFAALGREDPELARVVIDRLRREGVEIREHTKVVGVAESGDGIALDLESDGGADRVTGSHLLVAAGRAANVSELELEAAGIQYTPKGIVVDRRLRTSNPKVYAVGDVAGGYQFTHVASYHAGIVLRNALFRWPARVNEEAIPWVTYTDPELAHVGLDERRARERHGDIRVLRWPFAENDRARAERAEDGLVKVVTSKRGHILGATIVGAHGGELIQIWGLALGKGLKVGDMAGIVAPYPTLGEANVRAAQSYFSPWLTRPGVRRLVRLLGRLG